MKLAMTGGNGFLGWHVRVLLQALGWPEPTTLSRADLADPVAAGARMSGADRVLHLAGVNRGDPADVASGNVELAAALARGVRKCAVPPRVIVFANSVQAGNGTPYGDSKAIAAATLAGIADTGSAFEDVRLPHLYGEHGRPFYNSVVATFSRLLADGGEPEVCEDRELTLAHATDAAARLVAAPAVGVWRTTMPAIRISVRALADRLRVFAASHHAGEIPPLRDRQEVRLFNTYRSHCFPGHYPLALPRHRDPRGDLVEVVKARGGGGQTFCSVSLPGVVRGEHFHLAKIERFAVLRGSAEISLRRVGHREVLRFPVSGDEPVVVDMPTMWAHNIRNTGLGELLTVFWSNEVFDPERPDTYPQAVTPDSRVPVAA